jgi:hypothetical protein
LLKCKFRQRKAANLRVAVLYLFDDLGRNRAATSDLTEELRDFVDGAGAAVGEEENCGRGRVGTGSQESSV